jgi:hypothetical protein
LPRNFQYGACVVWIVFVRVVFQTSPTDKSLWYQIRRTSRPHRVTNYSVPKNVMYGAHWIIGCMSGGTIWQKNPIFIILISKVSKTDAKICPVNLSEFIESKMKIGLLILVALTAYFYVISWHSVYYAEIICQTVSIILSIYMLI